MRIGRCQYPSSMWIEFVAAVGEEAVARAFRGSFPLPTESVYEMREAGYGPLAGWGSYVIDAFGTSAIIRIGVCPAHVGDGKVKLALMDHVIAEAFRLPQVERCSSYVLLSNTEFAVAHLRRALDGTGRLKFQGVTLDPPKFHFSLSRQEYAARPTEEANS